MMLRRALKALLLLWGAASLLAVLAGGAVVLSAGWWLPVDDELKPADAIVLMAGDSRRAPHAADLYLRGLAPVIYTGRPMNESLEPLCSLGLSCEREEDRTAAAILAKGVPPQALRLYGHELMSTVDEGEHLARLLGPEVKTVIVVTSPHHCRRTKVILSGLLPGRELLFSPPPYERFERKWWTHQTSARHVIIEATKFLYYYLGTPFRSVRGSAGRIADPDVRDAAGIAVPVPGQTGS
jgi:uncharacterized SAM-binding protein YcdF (DUF218 family)